MICIIQDCPELEGIIDCREQGREFLPQYKPKVAVINTDLTINQSKDSKPYFTVSNSDITASLGLDVRTLILGIKFSRSLFLE